MSEKADFARTREALTVYDADRARRDKSWTDAVTAEMLFAAQAEEKVAATLVQDAFFEDTKAFNSRAHCSLVDPDEEWFRRVVGT